MRTAAKETEFGFDGAGRKPEGEMPFMTEKKEKRTGESLFAHVLSAVSDEETVFALKEFLRLPTFTPPGDDAAAADFLEDRARQEGLPLFSIEENGRILSPYVSDAARGLRRNLLFYWDGRRNLCELPQLSQNANWLAFTGHQDVVQISGQERQRWRCDPLAATQIGGRMYGRGACDMKGGLTAVFYALISCVRANLVPERPLALLATFDEEDRMRGSKAFLKTGLADRFAELVVAEPTSLCLHSHGRGRTWADLHFRGRTAHGSLPQCGINALEAAAELVCRLKKLDWSAYTNEDGASFIRSLAIEAGEEPQIVPDYCRLTIDARLTTGHEVEAVWRDVDILLRELREKWEGLSVKTEVQDRREAWVCEESRPLIHAVDRAYRFLRARGDSYFSEKVAESLPRGCFPGSTDGTILRRAGADTVILGPGDLACAHRENEYLDMDEYHAARRMYLALMLGL